MTKPMDD